MSVFWNDPDKSADRFEFCSWVCAFTWFQELQLNKKMISFVNLPYVTAGEGDFKTEYDAIMSAIRGLQGSPNNE